MLLGLISVTEGEIDFQGKPKRHFERKEEKRVLEGNSGDFPGPVSLPTICSNV